MKTRFELEPVALTPSEARLAGLELRLAERERTLADLTAELRALQSRYLEAVGPHYAELVELDRAIKAIEIRVGLRAEDDQDEPAPGSGTAADDEGGGCANRSAPTSDLKRIFRALAKSIHPDLALDEPARWRRHSLMAEANRAYAERDEDRLRLILHAWQRSPDTEFGDTEADEDRVRRRIGDIDTRLLMVDAEIDDLRTSAIGRLAERLDAARAQGWDLFAEMVAEVRREVTRARSRLAALQRL